MSETRVYAYTLARGTRDARGINKQEHISSAHLRLRDKVGSGGCYQPTAGLGVALEFPLNYSQPVAARDPSGLGHIAIERYHFVFSFAADADAVLRKRLTLRHLPDF